MPTRTPSIVIAMLMTLIAAAFGATSMTTATATGGDCVPTDGTPATFTDWAPSSVTGWQTTDTPPADPDGETGEANPANLSMIGARQDRTVIDKPAYEEEVLVTPAVPAVAAVWANFAPNDSQATFVGPPVWATDPRGTWIVHKRLPPGHAGPDGVYSRGNPAKGGNWFYRQAGTPGSPAVYETVLHEAETHPEYRWTILSRTHTPGTDPRECEPTDETVEPITPPVLDPCGPGNATWDLTDGSPSNGFTYDLDNTGILTLIAAEGYTFPGGADTVVLGTAPDSGKVCPPGAPVTVDPCGPGNVAFTDPVTREGIEWVRNPDGSITFTLTDPDAVFDNGYGDSITWNLPSDSEVECPDGPVKPDPEPPTDTPGDDKPGTTTTATTTGTTTTTAKAKAPAVPTAVDAGLPAPADGIPTGVLIGALLAVIAGFAGATLVVRRKD